MSKTEFKDKIILILDSGEFQTELITEKDLRKYAKENEIEDEDLVNILGYYVEDSDLGTQIGWTELDVSTSEARLKLWDAIKKLEAQLKEVN